MILRLNALFASICLMLAGNAWAEGPEIIVVTSAGGYGEPGATILYAGNNLAPPPLIIVDGKVVAGGSANGGPPDCSKAENRPICQALQFAWEVNGCGDKPGAIFIYPDGKSVLFKCWSQADPPPQVYVENQCVNCN